MQKSIKLERAAETTAWVRETQAGRVDVFRNIVERYERYVYSVAFSYTLNEQDALDLAQTVFLKVFASIRKLDDPASFTTWLMRIAENLCTDWARRQGRQPNRVSLEGDLDGAEQTGVTLADRAKFRRLLTTLVDMPVAYRTAFILHYLENLPYSDIARMLGVPFSTIVGRIHKAREFLRSRHEEIGLEP